MIKWNRRRGGKNRFAEADFTALEWLRTDTDTFKRLIESRRNRREDWFAQPAGHIELCSVPLPVRTAAPSPAK